MLCPTGVDLDLHLAIGRNEVGREALHIALVEVWRVENPLTAHLVLYAETHQQVVEAHGGEAVVLCYLCDGDRLRAAQDVSCIVRERFLLCGDFFEQGIPAFEYPGLLDQLLVALLQFVSSVLSDLRKDFRGDPSLEALGGVELGGEYERVESAFVDDCRLSLSLNGDRFGHDSVFFINMCCNCFCRMSITQGRSHILTHEISFTVHHTSSNLTEFIVLENLIFHNLLFLSLLNFVECHHAHKKTPATTFVVITGAKVGCENHLSNLV